MKSHIKSTAAIITGAFALLITSAFIQQQGGWKAPATADQNKNPIVSNEQTLAKGKALFNKECMSCHGKKGKGDGPASITVGKPVGDMATASFHAQSDGAIYWKIAEGKQPMPTFKKKLAEDQIWQIVNYIRTFKAK